MRPQRDGEAAGRVAGRDDLAVPVALRDAPPGEVDLGEVLVEVGDVVGGLVLAQRPAVLAQVEGVEGVAAVGPPPGVLGVEEVVGEAVHVQHRPAVGSRGLERDQGGDDGALAVGRERDGLDPVVGAEDVGLQSAPEACAEPSQRGWRSGSDFAVRPPVGDGRALPFGRVERVGVPAARGLHLRPAARRRAGARARAAARRSCWWSCSALVGARGRGRCPGRGRRAGVAVVPLPDARHDAAALRPARSCSDCVLVAVAWWTSVESSFATASGPRRW